MHPKRGRYSWLIRPILVVFDLLVITLLSIFILGDSVPVYFVAYIATFWMIFGYSIRFYEVYRFTSITTINILLVKQLLAFSLAVFAFYGFFSIRNIELKESLSYLVYSMLLVAAGKIAVYYALKKYRRYLGGNKRNVVIIGNTPASVQLKEFFNTRSDLGYNLQGFFSNEEGEHVTDSIENSFTFLTENNVDEVYCAIEKLKDTDINRFVQITKESYSTLKFIPSVKKIYSKRLQTDFYDYLPVLSFQDVSLDDPVNKAIKRVFDVIFSLMIIVFIMSWLIPIMFIIIKLESKGPLFYKHVRNGLNYEEFTCFKFRSMKHVKHKDLQQVTKDDDRVTKVGRFIRRTSIDELPQFFNVLLGDMSVVGPRPHMISYTQEYAKQIDKYNFLFRHSIKPGVTGLAQVKGYRGEIATKEEIVNRVKYDIFYIENWSVFLDIKIIFETVINLFKGQEKAY